MVIFGPKMGLLGVSVVVQIVRKKPQEADLFIFPTYLRLTIIFKVFWAL